MVTLEKLTKLLLSTLHSDTTSSLWGQSGWAILRVVAGLVMIHNGLDKLADIEGFAESYVKVIGLPFPIFFSYCAAFAELLGSPLLALGLLVRPSALILLSTMLVAIYHHILVAGFSLSYLELSTLYAGCFAFFALNGGGSLSLDHVLGNWLSHQVQLKQIAALKTSYKATEQIIQSAEDLKISK
jgi:putative oxidoreductase